MADPRTYTARWIVPVSSEPLANGTITIEGTTIRAVEPKGVRTPDVDLGNVAIIPGLVNCHTHLDLSGARGKIPPTDLEHFTDWLKGVIAFRRSRTPDQTQADIRDGLAECLRYGTTLVGDITAGGASWDAVVESKLWATVFHEFLGITNAAVESALESARNWIAMRSSETTSPRRGISPHAPYSVHRRLVGTLRFMAVNRNTPMAVHFAEWSAERELFVKKSGPLRELLEEMKIWRTGCLGTDLSSWIFPVSRPDPDLIVHANYLLPQTVVPPSASIVYCPRTHAAFGHPRHPFREFQARGVRVALGTDSLASNPDLDLLAEARFVHAIRPEVPCGELLRMATLTGAEALGWANETGSLEVGKSADFVALSLANRDAVDVYELIFEDANRERKTMFRGEWR